MKIILTDIHGIFHSVKVHTQKKKNKMGVPWQIQYVIILCYEVYVTTGVFEIYGRDLTG